MENEDEFFKNAIETFGDKINCIALDIPQEQIDEINAQYGCHLSKDDFVKYGKHAWLMQSKCPVCGEELFGFFGSFEWGLVHGNGHCGNCHKASFRYYHYIGDCKTPISGLTLIGFDRFL